MSEPKSVILGAGAIVTLDDIDLSKQSNGNMVRNSTFSLRWVSPELYDDWSQPKRPAKMLGNNPLRDWEGEWIPLSGGVTYSLTAKWKAGASADSVIFIRTKAKPVYESVATESAAISVAVDEVKVTGSAETAWGQICIRTSAKPGEVLESVSLKALP